jgi:hypothetical protein
MTTPGTLAITMAGLGSRFTDAGYRVPKYEIVVGGRPLFDWSMLGLCAFRDAGWTFNFAVRREQAALGFLKSRCQMLGITLGSVVELDGMTDGQATTARHLAEDSAGSAPFAVFNIDTFVAPGAMAPGMVPAGAQGWVPCFPGPGDGWSFARVDDAGRIVELREKVRISPHATVGLYWFGSAAAYLDLYRDFFAAGAGVERGERYIAPMYNRLIGQGATVALSVLPLDAVGMLGTPEQVRSFERDPPAGARPLMLTR